jgi:WD40 repeat protein
LIDLKFAGNSSKFAFTSFDYKIRIFDVEVREVVSTLEGNATETFKVCLDFEGNTVYTGGHSGEVAAMGTARGDKIRTMRTHNEHFVTSFASVPQLFLKNRTPTGI